MNGLVLRDYTRFLTMPGIVLAGAILAGLFAVSSWVLAGDHMDKSNQVKQHENKGETDVDRSLEQVSKDAWLQGKLETVLVLNRHLNPFRIDTEVKNASAYLSGNVDSDVEKDLAGELAKSIEGIRRVENKLVVDKESVKKERAEREQDKQRATREQDKADANGRDFAEVVEDATITAMIKSKLLWNKNTQGMSIDVDTYRGVVKLSGKVKSDVRRQLAEKIAVNVEGVSKVQNNLRTDR